MNSEDWAVVVGVSSYPGISDLQGPENDAQKFYEWLTSPNGGAIPVANPPKNALSAGNQAVLIKSSDFSPPFADVSVAKPSEAEIKQAFDYLRSTALDNLKTKGRFRVGRRLYLYFAGHGFAPSFGSGPNPDDAALLMANADNGSPGYHISGRKYAHWFFYGGLFQEIVLFMDCCRDNDPNYPANIVPYGPITSEIANRKTFFGFGTKWNRQAREREMDDGQWHGIFTTALLAGLNGAAVDTDSGNVTTNTLGAYLMNYMKIYFSSQERDDPSIEKEPTVRIDPQFSLDAGIIFAKPPSASTKFPVTVRLSDQHLGQQIEIIGERNGNQNLVIDSTTANEAVWNCRIEPGLYTLRASGGNEQIIEVIGHITAGGNSIGMVKVGDEKEKDYVEFR